MSGSAPLRVAVVGARGRLGACACALLERTPGFELVARYGHADDWRAHVRASGATLAFEATRAGLGLEHGLALLERGVRPVIATSGVDPDQNAELDARARALGLGGIVVPNFSLGALLLQRAAEEIARHFPAVEIIELHHAEKPDSPSGTAAETARRIAAARSVAPPAHASSAARGQLVEGIPVHSVRLPGLYAHQQVLFGAAGELLSLRHDMHDTAAFGPGILAALRFAASAVGVARGLASALHAG